MKLFTEHPESVGETYFEHMRMSFSFGTKMLFASIGCFLHAIFPFLCVRTGSSAVSRLHHDMVTHRSKLDVKQDNRDTRPAFNERSNA